MGPGAWAAEMDPQSKAALEEFNAHAGPEIMPPAELRKLVEAFTWPSPIQLQSIVNTQIPGPNGKIPVRIYTPEGKGSFPILVYYHGGGWSIGTLDLYDPTCRFLSKEAGVLVVAVDYRLAPEHKFPQPLQDCYAALQWTVEHASELHGEKNRIAVGGDSAGGNLAAAVALMARDQNGPKIAYQILIFPVIDNNFDTRSYQEFGKNHFVTRNQMIYYWNQYLNNPDEANNPYVAPGKAKNLTRLPPALVVLADFDPLYDEGDSYAKRLQQAGVPVTLLTYPSFHGFTLMYNQLDLGQKAMHEIAQHLKNALSVSGDH